MADIEASDAWLQGLFRLNEAIASARQPPRGNLCYEDLRQDYVHSPPTPLTRGKRGRFRNALHLVAGEPATVIMDDAQLPSVAWVWRSCVRHGVVAKDPRFDPMPGTVHDRNSVGELRRVSEWRWRLLFYSLARLPHLSAPVMSAVRRARDAGARQFRT